MKLLPFLTMPDDDNIPPLPDYAAELEAEMAFGPLPYTPEEGIRHMKARIVGLLNEIREIICKVDPHPAIQAAIYNSLTKQLKEARQRLAEYQLQHESRN